MSKTVPDQPHVVPCLRSSGRYGSSYLAGHVSTGFVLALWPKARSVGRFSYRVGLRPIKSTTTHFHYFIIFTNYSLFLPI